MGQQVVGCASVLTTIRDHCTSGIDCCCTDSARPRILNARGLLVVCNGVALLAGSLSPRLGPLLKSIMSIVHLLLAPGEHAHGDGAGCEKFGKIGFFSLNYFFINI
jgi:hypothetical protein